MCLKVSDEGAKRDDIVLPHHRVPNVVNQQQLINYLREMKTGAFVYLIYAVSRSSEHYTPYALM